MLKQVVLCVLALALVAGPMGSIAGEGPAPVVQAAQPRDGIVPNEVIVSFHGPVPSDIEAWAGAHGAQLLMRDDVIHWVSLRFADQARAEAGIQQAELRPDVKRAEHDGYIGVQFTPNDPLYSVQADWPAIHAPAAWDATRGSHSVKVAVLDTGIYTAHPDLAANMCGPFASFVPGEPTINDGFGHGTHVTGTIAAATNNGVGVAGASDSCIMGAKVLGASGGGQWSWAAAGIRWAADNGAQVMSMSWGGLLAPGVVGDAGYYAYNTKGVLLVAAAGNSGCPGNLAAATEIWPAIWSDFMAVAALNENGVGRAGFSSCGTDVEIAAPGVNVLSTFPPCTGAPLCSSSGYGRISGTSMATPHVSGVAALLLAHHPGISNTEARCILDLTAVETTVAAPSVPSPLPGVGAHVRDHLQGWGRVDALAALQLEDYLSANGLDAAFTAACTAGAPAIMWGGLVDGPTCTPSVPPVPRPCDTLPL